MDELEIVKDLAAVHRREVTEEKLNHAREIIAKLCNSMHPNPKEHPIMFAAKNEAQQFLNSF